MIKIYSNKSKEFTLNISCNQILVEEEYCRQQYAALNHETKIPINDKLKRIIFIPNMKFLAKEDSVFNDLTSTFNDISHLLTIIITF